MDGGERPAVEFLDDDPAAGTDEVLPPSGSRTRRLVLAGAAVLVLGGVVVARTAGSGSPSASGRTASPATVSPVGVGATAPVGSARSGAQFPPTRSLLRPIPKLLLLPTPHCPGGGCSVLEWAADATLNAITSSFPGEVVERQMSAFAPSASDLGAGHPLFAREVRARHGRETVVIDVLQVPGAGRPDVLVRRVDGEIHGTALVSGYVIAVRVADGRRGSFARVQRLLADPGLMAVR